MSRHTSASHFHKSKTLNDKYLLGDEIGKGAYGRVYKSLDLENGDFVAIKQVSLENIPAEDLASIMQEIDLLKNLNHKNIVKYQGSLKTKTHLYIILEYVENGSLASIIKPNKFGAFPESLVALYIAQVLEGLAYLHEQGVIHRDIKGANILTTKEGLVKLADFGVATKLTEADVNTHSVVGTPYWMAPEVIEMSGVTPASDIWSVGCTVIELLTCVPPYYDLQPMPALFRIVQDDHPPLPEHLSSGMIDFLHQCFRKDAKLRPDAKVLLKHPWIRNSRRALQNTFRRTVGRMSIPQDVSTVVERTIEAGQKANQMPPAQEESTLKDPVTSGNDENDIKGQIAASPTEASGELNVDVHAACGGAARLSPDEVSEKFDAYISASKESEQLNAFKHQPVEACSPDSKTLSSSVKGFKSDLDISESANGSQKGATNLDSNASRIEQQVISAANSQGTGSLLPQRAGTISSCDKQEQVEICAAVWITNKISQRDHKVCAESNDYQPTLEAEKSTPPNYELRFSDTPTNGILHELFEESFSRIDQSTIEGNTSAIIPKTHMTDQISASKSKLNGLAVDIKPKMAQKMVEDEVSLEKQNGENLFTALIDAVEDDELESNGLVFESNAEGRDCYANQVEKSMPPNYELKSSDTPADGILHELFEESFSRVDRSTIEGNTSAIITKPHMTDKISPTKRKLNGLAVIIKPKMAQKMVEGEVSLQKQNGENLFNALINAVEDDELESNGLVFESNAEGRDCYANQAIEVTRLINLLKPEEPEERIITVCQKLISMFHESPDQKSHLANQHGVMPLLEMLEVHNNRIVYAILQLINEIVKDNTKIQQNACLVGMIPAIMHFAAPECTREIRMQAAHFIQQMCKTSMQTLQMFVACRGLPVLVSFLEPDYAKYREMVHISIDCMWQVFELQSSTPKNDFCRIFAKSGVLVRLVNTIYSLNEATRLDSMTGVGPEKAYLQSRSGPLEHLRPLFGQFESVKPCSGQLDSARLHSGQTEIPRQTVGVLGSPKAWLGPEINPSASQLEQMTHILAEKYSRPISGPLEASNVKISVDYSLEKATPQEKLQLGGTVENAHSFLVQAEHTRMVASAREQLQQLHADFAQLTPQTDRELSKECFTISEVVQQSTDQASLHDHSSTSNEPTDTCCEQVPKLLALAEKEHFSKPFPSYLDHSPHYPASTVKTETSLPLLHHSSAIRKANGELEILLAAFAEKNDIGALELIHNNSSKNCTRFEMANASKLFPNASPQKYGAIHSSEGASSDSGLVSQSASGLLSGVGMLNARPGSAASSGLLSQTVSALNKDVAKEYLAKVGDLLFEFSRADTFVKSHMCTLSILIKLFTMLNKLEQPFLVKILKCIKELSMDPCTLELLQRADAPKHLIPLLQSQEGPYVSQIHSQVLNALYNLCKINKRRQEQAAECGIIPHLMHFITTNSPLKQIALPLLCDMAHASRYTREQLRVHKGLELYLGLLDDEYWAFTALDSLAVCLAHDNEHRKIEQALLKNGAVQKLVAFFQSCNGPSFVHILEPFLKIINKSIQLNTALAISGLTPLLVGRLQHQDAIARLSLLKLIKAVYEHHPRPKQLIVEHDLPSKLQKLIEERRDGEHSGGQVLVKQMATALLKALHINTIL